MPDGTYEEALPTAGTLKVTKADWSIRYYFSGPDRRYNGESFNVPGSRIDDYIDAHIRNWETYQELKRDIPAGGEFLQQGLLGMQIRVGGFADGLCLRSYHNPIRSQAALDRTVESYRYAAARARQVQVMLNGLTRT